MSKEVKRFTIGTFHAAIVSAGSECVLASEYDALLAERDALQALMVRVAKHAAYWNNSAYVEVLEGIVEEWKALQGEQP